MPPYASTTFNLYNVFILGGSIDKFETTALTITAPEINIDVSDRYNWQDLTVPNGKSIKG
jgi:hypothetical protein